MARTSNARTAVPAPRRALDRLLSADEVAEFLGIPVATLYQWRHKGTGADAYRVGGHLRYEPAAVRAHGSTHTLRITMAHIERRERRGKNGQVLRSYRMRWRGPDGKERNKSFTRKVDADRFAATVSADLVRGQSIDPDAGKILFETYARKWLAAQTVEECAHVAVELRFRLHAFPVLGQQNLNDIQPSTIRCRRGGRPPPTLIGGLTRPGLLGVLHVEHNLSMHRQGFASVVNLRLIVDSQRVLSRGLAGLTGDAEAFATGWSARAETYDLIHRGLRDVSDRIGEGADAAAEGANAVSRLRSVPRNIAIDPRLLPAFETLFSRVDVRIADIIDRGIAERLLFRPRRGAPRPDRHRWGRPSAPAPVRSGDLGGTDPAADHRARPRRPGRRPRHARLPRAGLARTPEAARSRSALHVALLHRPDGHGRTDTARRSAPDRPPTHDPDHTLITTLEANR